MNGMELHTKSMYDKMIGFEWDWGTWTTPIPLAKSDKNILDFSHHLQQKYAQQLEELKAKNLSY